MTTITKERIELFIKSPLENGLTRGEQMGTGAYPRWHRWKLSL
ncbi:Eaa protein [Salmonella enterica subsp. enterica serovar Typhimurium]|nr:Eaa protein [Salmonella enterica subsp. enterica serovar Typhimurium]